MERSRKRRPCREKRELPDRTVEENQFTKLENFQVLRWDMVGLKEVVTLFFSKGEQQRRMVGKQLNVS